MLCVVGVRRNRLNIIGVARRPKAARENMGLLQSAAVPGTSACARLQPHLGIPNCMRNPGSARPRWYASAKILAAVLTLGLPLGGCLTEVYQKGYLIPEGALEQIPIGASQEQVLIVLGTPSTVATVSGEVFYYISQRAERPVAFMPQQMVDQRVVAVYFDRSRRVNRLANYGMKDGKIFDYVARTTPTGGNEVAYLANVFNSFKLF